MSVHDLGNELFLGKRTELTTHHDLTDLFEALAGEKPVFVSSPDEKSLQERLARVQRLTLVSHGQETYHYLGDGTTEGLLNLVAKKGSDFFRLGSKEECNALGISVESQTAFPKEPFTKGEECVSFSFGPLSGYGEFNWVMPASLALQKGGMVSLFKDPQSHKTTREYLGGIHNLGEQEMDVYTPLGMSLLTRETNYEVSESASAAFIEKYKPDWGINLLHPLALLLLPEEQHGQVVSRINELPIDSKTKQFLINQLVPMRTVENDEFEIVEQTIHIAGIDYPVEHLSDPHVFALAVSANMRLVTNQPELEIYEIQSYVRSLELQVTEERFATIRAKGAILKFVKLL